MATDANSYVIATGGHAGSLAITVTTNGVAKLPYYLINLRNCKVRAEGLEPTGTVELIDQKGVVYNFPFSSITSIGGASQATMALAIAALAALLVE